MKKRILLLVFLLLLWQFSLSHWYFESYKCDDSLDYKECLVSSYEKEILLNESEIIDQLKSGKDFLELIDKAFLKFWNNSSRLSVLENNLLEIKADWLEKNGIYVDMLLNNLLYKVYLSKINNFDTESISWELLIKDNINKLIYPELKILLSKMSLEELQESVEKNYEYSEEEFQNYIKESSKSRDINRVFIAWQLQRYIDRYTLNNRVPPSSKDVQIFLEDGGYWNEVWLLKELMWYDSWNCIFWYTYMLWEVIERGAKEIRARISTCLENEKEWSYIYEPLTEYSWEFIETEKNDLIEFKLWAWNNQWDADVIFLSYGKKSFISKLIVNIYAQDISLADLWYVTDSFFGILWEKEWNELEKISKNIHESQEDFYISLYKHMLSIWKVLKTADEINSNSEFIESAISLLDEDTKKDIFFSFIYDRYLKVKYPWMNLNFSNSWGYPY